MRIAQLLENLDLGGMERLAIDLAVAHGRAGHSSSIYTLHEPGALATDAEAAGVPVISFHKQPGFSIPTIARLARRLRADGIQVLHTHNSVVHHYGVLAGQLARVPVVNTRHGVSLIHTRPVQETYFNTMIPLTKHFAFVSKDTQSFFESRGVPRRKSSVVLNGIPLDKWRAWQAQPGSRRPLLRCISVGRLVPVKAYDVLIDAFALAASRVSGLSLQIVGDGPLLNVLREKVRVAGLDDRVSFAGAVPDPERLLADADLFVMSSMSEGLPVAVLEAMAAGLPVIATRVGGVPEVLSSREGWLCEPGRADSLAEVMVQAANAPSLAAMGAAGRRLVFDKFSIERVQAEYESLFRSAQRPRSRSRD